MEYWSIVRDDYKEKKVKVDRLIDILNMMEDANFPLLHFLEVICEKSPPKMNVPDNFGHVWKKGFVRIGCLQHPAHAVSHLGFLLL